jgi:bacillithiol biosynthesis cysteine-adding enzyme BshC
VKVDHCLIEVLPFSNLFKEYVKESPSLAPFFSRFPSDLFKNAPHRPLNIERKTLVHLLKSYSEDLALDEASLENLKALEQEETYTVVTGQQIGLFGGYLYTAYKIITAIQLAQKLTKLHKVKVVPIFWIADEDHDFDEANHVFVPSSDKVEKIEVERVSGLQQQVAREHLPLSIQEKIEAFFEASGTTEFSHELKSWLEVDFTSKKTQKQAFLNLINRIFGQFGLLYFGSDHPEIKQAALPVFIKAITQAKEAYEVLESQSKKIEQVFARQAQTDPSNLFLNCSDGRIKLHWNADSDSWTAKSNQLSTADLLKKVEENPNLVSPNVFLRPIVQEFLLPNLAYIAGPGEIAYYAQTKTYFEFFGLEMPVIYPRLTATIIEKPFHRYWSELPVRFRDYFQRIEDLETQLVHSMQPLDMDAIFQQWTDEVNVRSDSYKQAIVHIDASLEQTVERALVSFGNELQKIKGKVFKALKQKDEVNLQRIRKVHSSVYPNNQLQERLIGFLHYLNRYGVGTIQKMVERDFTENIKAHQLLFLE